MRTWLCSTMGRYMVPMLALSLISLLPILLLDSPRHYLNRTILQLDRLQSFMRRPDISQEQIRQWKEFAMRAKEEESGSATRWKSFQNIYQLGPSKDKVKPDARQNAYVSLDDGGNVFLFSAVALNTTSGEHWDFFVVSAWETRRNINTSFICCFMHKDKTRQIRVMKKTSFKEYLGHDPDTAQGRQYICKNPLRGKNREVPKGVTIVRSNKKCPTETRFYLQPVLPVAQKPNSFVVCAKVVFGKANPNNLIEWLEYQKHFGVTKVVVYLSYDTNERAKQVLEYYCKEGFVEVIPVGHLPKLDQVRTWETKNNFINVAQDTAVILFDFQARCHGYTFGAVIDPDEFVLPKDGSKTFAQFMNTILQRKGRLSKMAAAKLSPEFHITQWDAGRENSSSLPMMLSAHRYHTPPLTRSRKNFYVTSRVVQGSIATHILTPKDKYTSIDIDPKAAVVRHFRNCEGKFKDDAYKKCLEGKDRILDTDIIRIASDIYPRVEHVRKELGIEFSDP